MTGFTDVFGGSTLQAAQVSYRALTLVTNFSLVWPRFATADNYASRIIEVTATAPALTLSLPDATLVAPGQDMFVNNRGSQAFTLANFAGNPVAVISPGQSVYIYLTANATQLGVWAVVRLGNVSSNVDASQLVGSGLRAVNNALVQASLVNVIFGDSTLTEANRASTIIWSGGTGTLTLPTLAASVGDFFVEIRNQGTGVLTIAPQGGSQIDGSASVQFQLGESASIHAGPDAWYTVGRGRPTQFSFTQLVKSVIGGSTSLTLTEASNVVQTYIGTLTSNQVVIFPAVVQVYYVANRTLGSFSLTFRNPASGTVVSIPSGQNAILFSDGTNVINASTTVAGLSSLVLAAGAASAPSLSLSTSNTGFYSSGTNQIGVTVNGVQIAQFEPGAFRVLGSGALESSISTISGSAIRSISRAPGSTGYDVYRSNGVNRWNVGVNSDAESGASAGSNYVLEALNDVGTSLGNAFKVTRATRVVDFGVLPKANAVDLVDLNSIQTLTNKTLPEYHNTAGMRNRIINGACDVAQRGSRTAGLFINGYGGPDRYWTSNGVGGAFVQAKSTVTFGGFVKSTVRQTVTVIANAAAFTGGPTWEGITQKIEGFNSYDLKGKPVSVSFIFDTNLAGTYSVAIKDGGSTQSYVTTFTVAANTPTKITVPVPTIPLAANMPNSNARGMAVHIGALNQGTFQTATLNVWQAANFFTATGATLWSATVNNYIQVTELQVVEGLVDTPFERRSYASELLLCQRYYRPLPVVDVGQYLGSLDRWDFNVTFPEMRATPSLQPNAFTTTNAVLSTLELSASSILLRLVPNAIGLAAVNIPSGTLEIEVP